MYQVGALMVHSNSSQLDVKKLSDTLTALLLKHLAKTQKYHRSWLMDWICSISSVKIHFWTPLSSVYSISKMVLVKVCYLWMNRGVINKNHSKRFLLDPACKALLYNNTGNLQFLIFVVSPHLYKTMLYIVHDLRGHFGVDRTSEFLWDYWWPGKRSDVKNYCDSCIQCAMKKGPNNKFGKVKTGHLRRGKQPFDDLFCDFVHMKLSSNGKKYIFTVIDSFSRYFFAIATCRDRAIDAAKALVREVILKFNFIPKKISNDRARRAKSETSKFRWWRYTATYHIGFWRFQWTNW